MGGELRLTSQTGEGACFSFSVELGRSTRKLQRTLIEEWARVTRIDPAGPVRALVADDVLENREILAELLTTVGVEVVLADNGAEAVEMARSERPDVVFMDIACRRWTIWRR